MGKPIVATDADGLLDVLTDDRDALIVPKRNPEALARAIVRLMDEPGDAGAPRRRGARQRPAVRHRGVRAQDGAALRPPAPRVARDAPEGRRAIGFVVSRHRARRRARRKGAGVTRDPSGSFVRGAPGTAPMRTASYRPGAVLALVLFCVYGGLALSVDFPRAAIGFQSDEATYYMMGYSLALDGDLTYRREDLMRVWREFPTGPAGVFLKNGRDVTDWGFMRRPPFVWTTSVPDPDPSRFYYGKSFIYSAFAAPFVRVFGTNGFLLFHAVLLALVAWCSYVFLLARMPASLAATLTGGFLMASVVPVYFVWIAPELFIFSLGLLAYFCWLYKQVATREQAPWGMRWLFGAKGDVVAAILLGLATFSKVTNALLFPPIVAWQVWRREWRQAILSTVAFWRGHASGSLASTRRSPASGTTRAVRSAAPSSRVSAADRGLGLRRRRGERDQRGADRHHLRPAGVRHQPRAQPRVFLRRPLFGPAAVLLSGALRAGGVCRGRSAAGRRGSTSSSPRCSDRC